MKLANVDGRAVLLTRDDAGFDVAAASEGRFGPDLRSVYDQWEEFSDWARTAGESSGTDDEVTFTRAQLGSPSPEPRQIIAIGLNYDEHAKESGFDSPDRLPPTFTKFVSSLSGPDTDVTIPAGGNVDWEVELVVIIGREAHDVSKDEAWSHVAGLAIGQDISERVSQLAGPAPQFSLGKSFPGFAPVGPWLTSVDAVENKDDLALGCEINGETMQSGRTRDLIFPVAELIAELSKPLTLYPGDLIFTGTPAGIGAGRKPPRFLRAGEHLHSWIEGLGELDQRFVDAEQN